MPAASADKRARQRANKLLQKESAPPALIPLAETRKFASPPIQPATATTAFSASTETTTPASWPAPAPATFTISYIPLSISYPEPENPAAKLPMDAVRVTRADLALLLRQSYVHGSEHGWKANVASAKERLQADYEKDMQDATVKFAEHEKRIRNEEFTRGFENGRNHFETQLASITETLKSEYEEQTQNALADILDHAQECRDEEYVQAFELGRSSGVQDERRHWESTRKPQVDIGTQVDL